MKKLIAVALALLAGVGCYPHCENATIFTSGAKGCRDKCIEKPSLTCDCNSNCPCHEHKEWQKEKRKATSSLPE